MATDDVALLEGSAIELVGAEMTRRAAGDVFKEAGVGPEDVQVVECHDCFSANEMYVPKLPFHYVFMFLYIFFAGCFFSLGFWFVGE